MAQIYGLQATTENLKASRGRFRDADFADERPASLAVGGAGAQANQSA